MTSPQAPGNPVGGSHVLLEALADELARCGVANACTSPGSRSSPIVLALAAEDRIRCWSHLDERVSGFFALGLAKATLAPVVVACTSGTAAAELAPAVHEAREAGVPLVVLTADRPPELRDVGAGQVIDQVKLYGATVKQFWEVGVDDPSPATVAWIRALACRAAWASQTGRPGPVHLNFPLREPLVPPAGRPAPAPGRPGGRPWVRRSGAGGPAAPTGLAQRLAAARRPLVVAGRTDAAVDRPARGDAAAFGAAWGAPVLADPVSGARRGPAAVAHYDALLRHAPFAAEMAPDLILRVGDLPTSKPLRAWLAARDCAQVAIGTTGTFPDPDASLEEIVPAPAPGVLAALAASARPADPGWLDRWRVADARAAAALRQALAGALSEPAVAAAVGAAAPAQSTVWAASSMPIRDVETFFPLREDGPLVLANRGANGIDGTVASALGAGAAGRPVTLLIGDVAFAYDATALISARRHGLALTVVLINNDGGGIFHFLPVAGAAAAFEEHIATPHGLDFAAIAAAFGAGHAAIEDRDALAAAVAAPPDRGVRVLEIRTDRAENVAVHRRCWAAVADALGG